VFFQFPDDGVTCVTEPAELRRFGIEIVLEVLFNDPGDAKQPLKLGTAGAMRCHRVRQELNSRDEVFAAVGFGEPGYVRETWPVLVHRHYEESAEVHRETMGLVRLAAIKGTRFVCHSLSVREGRAGRKHDRGHGLFEVIAYGSWHCATLANAHPGADGCT